MDKNDKTKDEKIATTKTQNFSPSADGSGKFSDSVVAASDAAVASEAFKKRIAELENQVKRALADYQNLEKRVIVERKEWILKSNKELLLRLLPILDTLILATLHSKDEGLTVGQQQFLNVLREEGVEKIETMDKDFDPMLMECIDTAEGKEGIVIEEIRAGYKLYDQVLRPAQVKVGRQAKS